jgi:hypothetical protein
MQIKTALILTQSEWLESIKETITGEDEGGNNSYTELVTM